jgi:N-acetyltransferase B complex (NatB) non catalytic subunit
VLDSSSVYRIGLMEYAMERSPYNFDISLQLLKLYDRLGLSPSFQQALSNLNLKGVQLESLGYLQFRHALDWGEIAQ